MDSQHLINMANDIGAFFESMPNQEKALQDLVGHMDHFWEKRMLKSFLDYVAQKGDGELKPLVRQAIPLLHQSLKG
jgi:formate dehydrogenase subunit delta